MKNALNDDYKKLYDVLTDSEIWNIMKDWWLTNGECEDLSMFLFLLQNSSTSKEFLTTYKKHNPHCMEYALSYALAANPKGDKNETIRNN